MGFLFEPATGANPVEVAVEIQAEQVPGVVARPARLSGRGALKAETPEVQLRDKGVETSNRMGGADILIEHVGQEDRLAPVVTSDVGHADSGGTRRSTSGPY